MDVAYLSFLQPSSFDKVLHRSSMFLENWVGIFLLKIKDCDDESKNKTTASLAWKPTFRYCLTFLPLKGP
jgi:hypothetical protein